MKDWKSVKYGFMLFILIIFLLGIAVGINYFKTDDRVPAGRFQWTVQASEKEEKRTLAYMRIKQRNTGYRNKPISCFDVNVNGDFAVGFQLDGEPDIISVYNSNGLFRYGYSFYSAKGGFNVKWEYDDLWIYTDDEGVLVDKDADCIGVIKILDDHGPDSYWNQLDYTKRVIGDDAYRLEGNFAGSYSRLVKIDSEGKKTTIFEVASANFSELVLPGVFIFIFLLGFMSIWQENKDKNNEGGK